MQHMIEYAGLKGDEIGVEKEVKHQSLLHTLGDSSIAPLAIASPLLIIHIDEDIFGDVMIEV